MNLNMGQLIAYIKAFAKRGATGPPGPQGPSGADGADGLDGQDATISVGSVTTLDPGENATVDNVGTPADAVFNFGIPAGIQGEQGIQGIQGLQGPQGIQGIQGETGPTGPTGPTGATGASGKTVRNATYDPASYSGNDGDFWINTTTYNMFGPKDAGSWPAGFSLIGPTGTTGAKGDTGATGATGAKGDTGATGSAGTNGTNGTDGKTIRNGTGSPSAGLGVDGDFYIATDTNYIYGPKASGTWPAGVSIVGPTGATGATGAKGDTGSTGATGATGATGDTEVWLVLQGNYTIPASKGVVYADTIDTSSYTLTVDGIMVVL